MPVLRPTTPNGTMWPQQIDRWFLSILVAATASALFLRIYQLGYESLDMDELVQVRGYVLSPLRLLSWAAGMGQPALDYVIGGAMHRLGLTQTDAAVRLPAVLFGAGSVLLLGLWAGRIAGRSVGIASAIFLAVCPFHVILSQHARQYTIFVFFALATLMAFDRARHQGSARNWTLFSLAFLGLLMTRWIGPHVLAVAIAAYTVTTWCAAHRGADPGAIRIEKRNLYATTVAMTIPYLISLPMFAMIMRQSNGAIALNPSGWAGRASDHLADAFMATLAGFSARSVFDSHVPDGWFALAAVILIVVGSVSLVRRAIRRRHRHAAIFLLALGGFPIVFAILFSCLTRAHPKPQYLLLATLPICFCMALAAKVIRNTLGARCQLAGQFAYVIIVSAVTLPMYVSSLKCLDTPDKRDWRSAMRYIRRHASPDDAFAVAGSDQVPSVFYPIAYGKHRYGIPHAKFLSISQTTEASALTGEDWNRRAGATWLMVYTDRMYLGYDQVRPPAANPPLLRVHRFNGLFLVESRMRPRAVDQLLDAIAALYRDLPPARSLIAPALLRAKYLHREGNRLAAEVSLTQAIRQCRSQEEAAELQAIAHPALHDLWLDDARAQAVTPPEATRTD